jgi:hypothetical protein
MEAPVDVLKWSLGDLLRFFGNVAKVELKLGSKNPEIEKALQLIRDPNYREMINRILKDHKLSIDKTTVGDFLGLLNRDARSDLSGGAILKIKKIPSEFDGDVRNDQDQDDVDVMVLDNTKVEDREDYVYFIKTIDSQRKAGKKAQINKELIKEEDGVYLIPEPIWRNSPSVKETNPYSLPNLMKLVLTMAGQAGTGAVQMLANGPTSSFFPASGAFPSGTQLSVQPQLGMGIQALGPPPTPAALGSALLALPQSAQNNVLSSIENASALVPSFGENASAVVPSTFSADEFGSSTYSLPEPSAESSSAQALQLATNAGTDDLALVPSAVDAGRENATAVAAAMEVEAVAVEPRSEEVKMVETTQIVEIARNSMARRENLFLNGSAPIAMKVLDAEKRHQMMARVLEYARASKCVLSALKGVRAKLVAILSALLEITKRAGPIELEAADVNGMTTIIEEMKRGVEAEVAAIGKHSEWIAKIESTGSEGGAMATSDALETVYKDMGAMLIERTNYQGQLKQARIASVATAIGKASARIKFSSAALASLQEANSTHQSCAVQYEAAVSELANSAWDLIKVCEKGSEAEKAWVRVEKIFRGEDAYALLASQNSDTGFPAWPEQVAAYEVPKGQLGASALEMCDSQDKMCITENLAPTEIPEVVKETGEFWKQKIIKMVNRRGQLPHATLNISAATAAGKVGLQPYKIGSEQYSNLLELVTGKIALDTTDFRSVVFQVLYALAAVHSEVGASLHLFRVPDDLRRVKLFEGPLGDMRRVPATRNLLKADATLEEEIANYSKRTVDVLPTTRIYAIVPEREDGDTRLDWSIATRSPWVQLDIDYSRITGGKPSDVSRDARSFLELLVQKSSDAFKSIPSQILKDLKPRSTIWNMISESMGALRSTTRIEVPDFVIRGQT